MFRKLAPVLAGLFIVAVFAAPASAKDFAMIARDIVPSGQYGSVPAPPNATQQAAMYDALTPLFNHVTSHDLLTDFKPDYLGGREVGPFTRERVPHAGVTITRDPFHVPEIKGKTRDDVTWGAGWVIAEDRGLLLQQARYDALVAAIDAPGLNALDLVSKLETFQPSAQTERVVARQTNQLRAAGLNGRGVLHDLHVYIQGINAYIDSHNHTLGPFNGVANFTLVDIYAFNALKDQFVGEGGGQEATNADFLSGLRGRLGTKRGTEVFHDLRNADDPEAYNTLPGKVQLMPRPTSDSGNVVIDHNSLSSAADHALQVSRDYTIHASNELLISGKRSSTHHPIMVAGPQIHYYYPGLVLEMDLEGPGISQRGITSAPFPGYVFIGRNQYSGWSLTSAGLDQIDTYVETLCGHSQHRYMFDGKCRKMEFFNAGVLNPGTSSAQRVTFYRTVHGPVFGYARVHGRLVALTRKRSSYGKDALDLLFYRKLADGQVHNVHQFFRAADLTPQTFNSLYVDDRDIGMFTSGLVPIRPRNVHPDLPLKGTGMEEWHGWTSFKNHPQGIDPPSGEIVNWNNRSQGGYEAPDSNWILGSTHRVNLLLNALGHGDNLTPARVVSAVNEAATQDFREMTFEPVLSKLLHKGPEPSALDAKMLSLLDQWYRQKGSRLDRTGNGQITAPGAAILDTAWGPMTKEWASVVLGKSLSAELATFVSPYDAPPKSQETTWVSYMYKDIRTILGEKVKGKYNVRYCGGGSLKLCRRLIWGAMTQAGRELEASQGPNPADWHSSATAERISFVPGVLTSPSTGQPFTIRYTNRPTGTQQILSFYGHPGQRRKPPGFTATAGHHGRR